MEKKEFDSGNKKFSIKELLAIEFDEITKIEDSSNRVIELVKKSTGISEEDYSKLTVRERSKIIKEINIINGWDEDFRDSEIEKKS